MKALRINDKFKPLFDRNNKARYFVITGGRGSSKSFTTNTWACINTFEPGHRTLFSRFTMTSAEISIIPEFEEKLQLLGVASRFKTTKKEITNIQTNSDIIFRGIKTSSGNQTAKLKSITGLTTFILDEAEELEDENTFDTIDDSIRKSGVNNRIIIVMNPTTVDHWVYQRWFEKHLTYVEIDGHQIPVSNHPEIVHIHTTYLDNIANLSDSFIAKIEQTKINRPKKYKHRILGGWLEKAEGVIFENWMEGGFDWSLPYIYGLDLGYFPDPLAMCVVAVDKKQKLVYIKELIYDTKLSTDAVKLLVGNMIEKPRDLIISDTNEPRLFHELRKKGLNIQKASKQKDSVINGIRSMQDYTLIIDPKSYNLKKELNNYAWNDQKSSTPIDEYNHLIDAARYAFSRLVSSGKKGVRRVN